MGALQTAIVLTLFVLAVRADAQTLTPAEPPVAGVVGTTPVIQPSAATMPSATPHQEASAANAKHCDTCDALWGSTPAAGSSSAAPSSQTPNSTTGNESFNSSALNTTTSPNDPFVVRIEIGAKADPKLGNEQPLAIWSVDNHVATQFYSSSEGKLSEVLRPSLNTDDPRVWDEALQLNQGLKSRNVQRGDTLLLPLGSLKHDTSSDSRVGPLAKYVEVTSSTSNVHPWYQEEVARKFAHRIVRLADRAEQEKNPAGPAHQIIQLALTRTEVASLKRNRVRYEILTGKFVIERATGEQKLKPRLSSTPLSPTASGALALLSSKTPKGGKPLVIVLDDSFPSDVAYKETYGFIASVYPALWKFDTDLVKLLPDVKIPPAAESTGVPRGADCASLSECDTHARGIELALQPYRDFAKTKLKNEAVEVIFIPYSKAQRGAKEILTLLWDLFYIHKNSSLKIDESLEQQFQGQLQEKYGGKRFPSDYGVLYSVENFAKLYARYRHVPVFLSISWTTRNTEYENTGLNDANVLLVAAAGNNCENNKCVLYNPDKSESTELIESARFHKEDIVMVMDLDADGSPTCNSTRLPATQFNLIGFDGAIAGDCGTSYSTPRTAWLFGLHEAYRASPDYSKGTLFKTMSWIFTSGEPKAQCKRDDDFKCIALSLPKFIGNTGK